MQNIPLDKILCSLDYLAFHKEAMIQVEAEESKLRAMLEDSNALVQGDPIPLIAILSGTVPAEIMYSLLIERLAQRIVEVAPDTEDSVRVAARLVNLLVYAAFKKTKDRGVTVIGESPSYPYINAIMNCGLFDKTSDPEVFMAVLADLGYTVGPKEETDAKDN